MPSVQTLAIFISIKGEDVVINFICPESWQTFFLGVSLRVYLEEISILNQ